MAKVFYRSAARRDLIAQYIYLADNANEATAERFLTNAEASFRALSIHPKAHKGDSTARGDRAQQGRPDP